MSYTAITLDFLSNPSFVYGAFAAGVSAYIGFVIGLLLNRSNEDSPPPEDDDWLVPDYPPIDWVKQHENR